MKIYITGCPGSGKSTLARKLAALNESLAEKTEGLDELLIAAKECAEGREAAEFFAEKVVPAMQELRACADETELCTAKKYWPFPTYGDILFSVS